MKTLFHISLSFFIIWQISSLSLFAQNKPASNCDDYEKLVFLEEQNEQVAGEILNLPTAVSDWYLNRNCTPIWYNELDGFAEADSLIQLLSFAPNQANYHLVTIDKLYTDLQVFYLSLGLFDYSELSELDVVLSDAALSYAVDIIAEENPENDFGPDLMKSLTQKLGRSVSSKKVELFYTNLLNGEFASLGLEVEAKESELIREPVEKVEEVVEEKEEKLEIQEEKREVEESESESVNEIEAREESKNIPVLAAGSPAAGIASLFTRIDIGKEDVPSLFGEQLKEIDWIKEFYTKRGNKPAWHNGYTLFGRASDLVKIIEFAWEDGLNPTDYHFYKIAELYNLINTVYDAKFLEDQAFLAKLDVLLSDAGLHFARHLFWGKTDPTKMTSSWDIEREERNLVAGFQQAIEKKQISSFFDSLMPEHPDYKALKRALKKFLELEQENKWVAVSGTEKLDLGMKSSRVAELRTVLAQNYKVDPIPNSVKLDTIAAAIAKSWPSDNIETRSVEESDLSFGDEYSGLPLSEFNLLVSGEDSTFVSMQMVYNPELFDTNLLKVVKTFQESNGLATDGVVGKNTIGILNASPKDRVNQIKVNLERWRWMPNKLGEEYILVNIPSYLMWLYEEEDSVALEKKVMVGKTYHKTPVFNDQVLYLDLNPYWTVPYSIATKEILPKLKRDPSYLARNNMKVFTGGKTVSANSVDWNSVSRSNFRYTFRQEPSAKNALGIVKFLFPNQYNIYLHDTPSKNLFVKSQRAYSHGCIRLENPVDLAEYLLKEDPKWSREKIDKTLQRGKNKRIYLPEPLKIYILYFTAKEDLNGNVVFANDIYKRDLFVLEALKNQ